MTGIEVLLSFFLGLLGNALTELASQSDGEKRESLKKSNQKLENLTLFLPL